MQEVRKRRDDIDGLRAIAVLSVVLYHYFPALAPGGFIGVDVFFVISGFLITGLIVGDLKESSFSFGGFYARRIRRLFPSLLAILIASYAFGWFVLSPEQFEHLGAYLAAAAAFGSNFLSLHEAGYFSSDSHTKPFLHLWSLGIEEQFYVLWPILLWVTYRLRVSPLVLALIIGVTSFVLNVAYLQGDLGTVGHDVGAVAAFYSPLARFWELMLGAIVSLMTLKIRAANILSIAGAVLLALSIYGFVDPSSFPGWLALLPTLGAAFIIAAGRPAAVNRVLSHRVLQGIGTISYPLYLWHWPLLSFATIMLGDLSVAVRAGLLASSVVLSYATWRFVERPIRFGASRPVGRIAALCGALFVMGAIGLATVQQHGMGWRFDSPVANRGEIGNAFFFAHPERTFHPCEPSQLFEHRLRINGYPGRCVQTRAGVPTIALLGDSVAEDLIVGLAEAHPQANIVTYIRNAMPFASKNPNPDRDFSEILDHVIADRSIDTVIIGAQWGWRQAHEVDDFALGLDKTVDLLVRAGKMVYLLDGRPTLPFEPDRCKLAIRGKTECTISSEQFLRERARYWPILSQVAANHPGVKLVPVTGLCDGPTCSMAADGQLLFRDSMHLTLEGSRYVVQRISPILSLGSE